MSEAVFQRVSIEFCGLSVLDWGCEGVREGRGGGRLQSRKGKPESTGFARVVLVSIGHLHSVLEHRDRPYRVRPLRYTLGNRTSLNLFQMPFIGSGTSSRNIEPVSCVPHSKTGQMSLSSKRLALGRPGCCTDAAAFDMRRKWS